MAVLKLVSALLLSDAKPNRRVVTCAAGEARKGRFALLLVVPFRDSHRPAGRTDGLACFGASATQAGANMIRTGGNAWFHITRRFRKNLASLSRLIRGKHESNGPEAGLLSRSGSRISLAGFLRRESSDILGDNSVVEAFAPSGVRPQPS